MNLKKDPMPKWLSKNKLFFIALFGGVITSLCVGRGLYRGNPITRVEIANELQSIMREGTFPRRIKLRQRPRLGDLAVHYTLHPTLHLRMDDLLKQYKPDYAAFVAINPQTGAILALNSFVKSDKKYLDHLALRATFPSASVFKIITAAAVLAQNHLNPDSFISFSGQPHTLYKRNVFSEKENRWTSHLSLRQAFARSVNSVFGKIGVYFVGPVKLLEAAEKFGFNRAWMTDLPVAIGHAQITEDPWQLAESASGFTKENQMSPLLGASIAATIANGGSFNSPFIVRDLLRIEDDSIVYRAAPEMLNEAISAETARELKVLMRETVRMGTSRGSFRNFFRGKYANLDVGGKTGSLTGAEPSGKIDWFVGYADSGKDQIAISALTVSKEYWTIKSSMLARKAFEFYFQ